MTKKRLLSFALALSMVLSLVTVPSMAVGENVPTITLKPVEFSVTDEIGYLDRDVAKQSVNIGDAVAIKVVFSNTTAEDIELQGYSNAVCYDASVFELYSQSYSYTDKKGNEKKATVGPIIRDDNTDVPGSWSGVDNTGNAGIAIWNGTGVESLSVSAHESAVLGILLLKVKEDATIEAADYGVYFDQTEGSSYVKQKQGDSDEIIAGMDYSSDNRATVHVNGATPTLTSVSLPEGSDTVTVAGSGDPQTIQATAASAKGTDLTTSVAWSVSPADGGVSIDAAAGVITVGNKAKAGNYTITAAPKDGKVQGDAQTATLTVARDRQPGYIYYSLESKTVEIPVAGTNTVNLNTGVYDQFGEIMDDASVTFDYSELNNISGIRVQQDGNRLSVSVTPDAKNPIKDSRTYTINVSYEGLEVKTVQLTIQRGKSVPTRIAVSDIKAVEIPTDGSAVTRPVAFNLYDQYGTSIVPEGACQWSISPEGNGIQLDASFKSGTISITRDAIQHFNGKDSIEVTVTVTADGVTGSNTLTLTRKPSIAASLTVSGGQESIEIPADTSTKDSAAFTVAVTDQYGQPMDTPENVTWTIKDSTGNDVNGVTIDNGVVKVTSAAVRSITTTDGKEFTVTATGGGQFGTAKITVKRAEPKVSQLMFRDEAIRDDSSYSVPTSYGTNGKEFWAIVFKDQYGAEMNVPAEDVTWTFPTLEGVSFGGSTSGSYHCLSITVNKDAAKNSFTNNALQFTVTATYKHSLISASMTCTLTRLPAQASSIELDGTDSDTVVIPSSNKKYTATVKDQYGLMMPGAQVTYSISPEDANVTIDSNGLVTVLDGATKDREYTITATYSQNVTATRTFKVVDKVSDTTTLKVEQADITFGESVNPQVTGAPAGTTAVTFTYEALEGSALTDGQPVNKGQYKVIARCESDTTIYTAEDTFEIKAKAITADMFTVTEKTYTYNGIGYDFEYQTTLVKNTDYTVTGTSHKDTGTYTVAFAGQGNYTGEVKVAWTIAPAVLKVKSVQLTSRAYDPSSSTVSVAAVEFEGLVAGETLSAANNYIAQATLANNNAGTRTAQVTVTLRTGTTEKAKNYTFENGVVTATVSADVQITKIAYKGTTTASTSAKYGNTATLDLSALGLPEGYDFAQGTVQDENGILAGAEAAGYYVISGNTLRVPLVNNAAKAGKTATITIPISSTNYENFDLVITVTVNDKLENSLAANDIYLTYGDTGYVTVTSIIGSLQTEIAPGEDVIALDNGTIKTLKAGEATLKLTASGDENYAEKSIQVKVTVSPKPITLTIDSKSAYVNDVQPALTYKVNGLVGADVLTTEPVLYVDVAEGVDPMKQVGTYAIKTSVTPSAGDNYSLTVAEGTLSVTNRPSAITPVGPSAGTVRVDETEGGTVRVTPANAAEGSTVTIVVTPDQGQELRSLEVLDKDGDSLELTDLGGGRFSFEMPRGKVTVKAEFGKAGLPYHDVKEGDWFYSAVEYVTEAGLMGDTGHGSFEPNTNTTRAMIWAILARLSGVDTTPVSGPWYSVAQQWAMNSGVSDGTNPNGAITREQLVTMLYRYAETHGIDVTEGGMAIREFADVESVSSFAGPAMTWAVNTGLISGIDGKLVPQGLATRSQVVTVLMRFAQLAK